MRHPLGGAVTWPSVGLTDDLLGRAGLYAKTDSRLVETRTFPDDVLLTRYETRR